MLNPIFKRMCKMRWHRRWKREEAGDGFEHEKNECKNGDCEQYACVRACMRAYVCVYKKGYDMSKNNKSLIKATRKRIA